MTSQLGKLGPYILERRLGGGGMAEIYLAKKPLGPTFKQVVVKRMHKELIDDERFEEMFMREAGILATLNHPNVVQIFDLGRSDDGELYIALEYLDGISVQLLSLKAARAQEPLPLELCMRIIAEAARGLDYVHRQAAKLVHRDVSPDNLFFVRDGTVKLLDFGVARGAQTKLLTGQGELKGKIPYMSPEQLETNDLDGRSDLFSLGVTAYWLLTGRRPFRGNTAVAIMRAIVSTEPEPVGSVNPDIPEWLQQLVMALLEKERERRPQTGAEVDLVIQQRAHGALDRAADVTFVRGIMDLPEHDFDDVSHPVLAVPRAGTVKRSVPRPVTIAAGPTPKDHDWPTQVTPPPSAQPPAASDPFPGDTMRLADPPALHSIDDDTDSLMVELAGPPRAPAAQLDDFVDDGPTQMRPTYLPPDEKPLTSHPPSSSSGATATVRAVAAVKTVSESTTTGTPAATATGKAAAVAKGKSGPMPKAARLELPVDGEGGDTVRVTRSDVVDKKKG